MAGTIHETRPSPPWLNRQVYSVPAPTLDQVTAASLPQRGQVWSMAIIVAADQPTAPPRSCYLALTTTG